MLIMKVINSQISSRECNFINNRSNGIFDYALLTKTKGGQQILKRNNIPRNNCPRGDNVDLDTVSGWTIFLGEGGDRLSCYANGRGTRLLFT